MYKKCPLCNKIIEGRIISPVFVCEDERHVNYSCECGYEKNYDC